jgi:membrane-bound lytic murein transglycosylase D
MCKNTFFKNSGTNLAAILVLILNFLVNSVTFAQNGEMEVLFEQPDTTYILPVQQERIVSYADREVKERLGQLDACLSLEFTAPVRGYLNTYLYRKTQKTEIMLGKRLTYFPIFEQKLKEAGLPADLKYLAVVESALNPIAVSRAGATGLWQFMPETGSEYNLRQNGQVDERSDVIKSTEAAVRYLKALHNQFGDWALALAAYNSGPTRVRNAIKRSGSRNFWRLQRFLPAETANYVPAFVAASYICNYWDLHNLTPENPDMDQQITSYIRVWEGMSFSSIADATGIDYSTIKALNPGYKRDYIPANMEGSYVVVPTRSMTVFTKYLNSISSQHNYSPEMGTIYVSGDDSKDGRYAETLFRIEQTDHIDRVGLSIGANGEHIKSWNKLTSNYITAGTFVKVFRPIVVQEHQKLNIQAPKANANTVAKQAYQEPTPYLSEPVAKTTTTSSTTTYTSSSPETVKPYVEPPKEELRVRQFKFHTVRRNESLEEIARKYNTSAKVLRDLNDIKKVKVGMRLKIEELF